MMADAILVAIDNSFGNLRSEGSMISHVSGYTGSNGRAVISQRDAILSVDGRYIKQATEQTDHVTWKVGMYPEVDVIRMLSNIMKRGQKLVIGPFSASYKSYVSILQLAEKIGFTVTVLDKYPLAQEYTPDTTLFLMSEADMGETRASRIERIQATLANGEAVLLGGQSVVGWIFGIRRKITTKDKSVVPTCVALITKARKPVVFCDLELEKVTQDFDFVHIREFETVTKNTPKATVICDFSDTPSYFPIKLQECGFAIKQSSVNYGHFEAIKNPTEIANQKKAAEMTSTAFIKALAYIENCASTSEIEVINLLENELRKNELFVDLSFNAISSFGRNTSIVHYTPETFGDTSVNTDGLFLLDAGAHFRNSTTDMTRIVYRGPAPPDEIKRIYTTVLKSVIMFSSAQFPDKTKAHCLDSIARFLVWKDGFDYQFGTGHGVGSFGKVHEHPRVSTNSVEEITGNMVLTIEPGIYKENFGIRLENMLLTRHSSMHTGFVEFETINFIPYSRKLINNDMLDAHEVATINSYHVETYRRYYEYFADDPVTLAWLKENTMAL
jgi:Xaa-Pro aminopeptidase